MKNIQLVLLTIGLIVSLAACTNETAPEEGESTSRSSESAKATSNAATQMRIAYVNTDTIRKMYKLYAELEEEMVQERLMAENQFSSQVSAFEKDYTDAQREAAGLSQEALQILQRNLATREQELMQQKEALESNLIASEEEKLSVYTAQVKETLKEFSEQNGYEMIMAHSEISNLLYIDESFDVTAQVVELLNQNYDAKNLEASK